MAVNTILQLFAFVKCTNLTHRCSETLSYLIRFIMLPDLSRVGTTLQEKAIKQKISASNEIKR